MARIKDITKRNAGGATPRVEAESLDRLLSETASEMLEASNRVFGVEPDLVNVNATEVNRIVESVRGLLSDQLTVVTKLSGEAGIAETELQREIAKDALTRLRLEELQSAARGLRLAKSGSKAQLIERLVNHYRANSAAIAGLIQSVERRPTAGRRHGTRLFGFGDLPESEVLFDALHVVQGSYVRTDLAKWFLVETVQHDGSAISLRGSMRTYNVDVDQSGLAAHPQSAAVDLVLYDEQTVLRSTSAGEPEAVSAVEAFSLFVDALPDPPVPSSSSAIASTLLIDHQTAWLLGVLLALLDAENFSLTEVTAAGFDRNAVEDAPLRTDTPHVGSARLRGQHVLDSQSACKHLKSGERLRSVTALVEFSLGENLPRETVPVRIAVETGCISVSTGFGRLSRETSAPLHSLLEDFVVAQMTSPSADPIRLAQIVDQMIVRADAAEPPLLANLFASAPGEVSIEH